MNKKQAELFYRALFSMVAGIGAWAMILTACAGAQYIERILGL